VRNFDEQNSPTAVSLWSFTPASLERAEAQSELFGS